VNWKSGLALAAWLLASAAAGWNIARMRQAAPSPVTPKGTAAAAAAVPGAAAAATDAAPEAATTPVEASARVTFAPGREEGGGSEEGAPAATHVAVDLSDPQVRARLQQRVEEQKEAARRRHAATLSAAQMAEDGGRPPE
jgi:hypothetical protein